MKNKRTFFKVLLVIVLVFTFIGGTTASYYVRALPDDPEQTQEQAPNEEPQEQETPNEEEKPPEETQEPEVVADDEMPSFEEQGFFTRLFGGLIKISDNQTYNQIMTWIYRVLAIAIAIWYKIKTGKEKLKAQKEQNNHELTMLKNQQLTAENKELKASNELANKRAKAIIEALSFGFDRSNLREDAKDKIHTILSSVEKVEPIAIETVEKVKVEVVEPIKEALKEQPVEQAKPLEW